MEFGIETIALLMGVAFLAGLIPVLLILVALFGMGLVGAHLALRVGGKMIRPMLVVMALALTAKLLVDPDNPLSQRLLG